MTDQIILAVAGTALAIILPLAIYIEIRTRRVNRQRREARQARRSRADHRPMATVTNPTRWPDAGPKRVPPPTSRPPAHRPPRRRPTSTPNPDLTETRPGPTEEGLRSQISDLRHRIHNLTAQLADADEQLADADALIIALESYAARLEGALRLRPIDIDPVVEILRYGPASRASLEEATGVRGPDMVRLLAALVAKPPPDRLVDFADADGTRIYQLIPRHPNDWLDYPDRDDVAAYPELTELAGL